MSAQDTRKVVLVTGGARGIGGAIVQAFAADHPVAFTWHSGAEAAAAQCAELPGALSVQADLADPALPAAAREFAPAIRVNAVRPGLVERDHDPRPQAVLDRILPDIPLARPGTPRDIASVARFLASPQAAYITGECITVGGGYGI